MKEPNKIDGNRRDLLKGLGIAAVVSLLPETGNAAQIMPPRKRHGIFLSPAKSLTHCPKATIFYS